MSTVESDISNLLVPILMRVKNAPLKEQAGMMLLAMGVMNEYFVQHYLRLGVEGSPSYEQGVESAKLVIRSRSKPPG